MTTITFDDFERVDVKVAKTTIFIRRFGRGPPLLMLHGFPQTSLMWRDVAPLLAVGCTVVCADLRGYGRSGCPASTTDHAPYSKRAMAADMVSVMDALGYTRFSIAGHDRGGRVAYRLALDHPQCVERLAVLDVVTIADAWDRANANLARAYWPWSLLAQPAPLPERLISAAPDAVIDDALSQWGSSADVFRPVVRGAYVDALRDPAHVHAICEEYRAAATLDYTHDAEDRRAERRIACPLLVLWSAGGALDKWYEDVGGPLALWRAWAHDVRGYAIDGGHFFPEEAAAATAEALRRFFES